MNYIANTEANPTRILFENGRVVELVGGALEVGWSREEAARVFCHQVGNEVGKAAPGVYTIGRWDYDDEDRAFYHTDFSTDAILKLDGDWSSVQQRQEFAARVLKALHYEFVACTKPEPDYKALYHELIFAVGNKYEGATRHQTALRYITRAEQSGPQVASASVEKKS